MAGMESGLYRQQVPLLFFAVRQTVSRVWGSRTDRHNFWEDGKTDASGGKCAEMKCLRLFSLVVTFNIPS